MLGKIIQIVLWLLAFCGIALLVVLGLVLLLVILLLFAPFLQQKRDDEIESSTLFTHILLEGNYFKPIFFAIFAGTASL